MELSDPYCSVAEYKLFTGKTTSADDAILPVQLRAMSRWLDRKLNQPFGFNKDGAVTTRYFRGDGSRVLSLPVPIALSAGVAVTVDTDNDGSFSDETAEAVTNYELWPRGNDILPEPWPFTQIYLPAISTRGMWDKDYLVRVVARFGWPAVPDGIKWATAELVAMVAGNSIFTTGRVNEMDAVVDASPQARAILRSLYEVYNTQPIAIG